MTLLGRSYSNLRHLFLNQYGRISTNRSLSITAARLTKEDPIKEEAKKSEAEPKKISHANRPMENTSPITWRSLIFGGGVLAVVTGYVMYLKNERRKKVERERSRTIGKAAIGGSFELVDTNGNLRKSDEFLGRWLLIYFGFTHCPDVCPEELEKLSKVIENLGKAKYDIVPLFITVDPERDTPEMVKKYLEEFSDKFIGLTGTTEQVDKATRAYRVYYSAGPRDKDNDYIVDHTIISYLIDPKGELVDYFGQTKDAEEIEKTVIFRMKTHKT